MKWPLQILCRVCSLFHKEKLDAQMDDEIRSHIEMQTQENIDSGMNPEEARYAALRQFGWVESIKETCREQGRVQWPEYLVQDLRFAARQLRKTPGFTAVAVLTLALGIGANTVMFSVAKAVLFRSLGFDASEELVWLSFVNRELGTRGERFSWSDLIDLREPKSFESIAAFNSGAATWAQRDRTEELPALNVTPDLAKVLRIRPALGRLLTPSDAEESAGPVAMISYELWQSRFAGSADILGRALPLNDHVYTVVGVLPPHLEFPLARAPFAGTGSAVKAGVQDFWFPLKVGKEDRQARGARMFLVIGRLNQGVSIEVAQAELKNLAQRWEKDFPQTNRGWGLSSVRFHDQVLGRTGPGIKLLAAAVIPVLLICCVNVANLLLARGVARHREIAVRMALGAGRGRIISSLLAESLLLSLFGGVSGIVFAELAIQGIRALGQDDVPFIREATLDGTVLMFTAGLSFVAALLFGFFPAVRLSRVQGKAVLRSGTRTGAGPGIRALQQGLVAGQFAAVLVLLASAALLLESFRRIMNLDLGYSPQQAIAIDLTTPNVPTNDENVRVYRQIKARLAALPGVKAVGTVSSVPLVGKWTIDEKAQVFGHPVSEANQPSLAVFFIAFDYFQAMGIPLIAGRFFRDAELRDNGPIPLAILNQAAAARLFPGETALGKRFAMAANPETFHEVIGVVKDTRDVRLEERPQPGVYLLYAFGGAQLVVRSALPARAMTPLLRQALMEFSNKIILHEIRPMTDVVSATVADRRFVMALLAIYAFVSLTVAAVGIFGVMAYQVAQRTNEFGVRLALGATRGNVMHLVLKQASRPVIIGLVSGLLLSFGTGRLLASELFGLSPNDPLLLTSVSLLLMLAGLLASFFPGRKASRLDPMVALRYE